MTARLGLLVAVGAAPLLASCLAGRPAAEPGPGVAGGAALGSFAVSSRQLGEATLAPSECTAGDRQLFLGADLTSPGAPLGLRLAVDPLEGPGVRVFATDAPLEKAVVFHRSDCTVFRFSLDATGWRVNDVNDYRLALEIDCGRVGERVRGSASSTHCH